MTGPQGEAAAPWGGGGGAGRRARGGDPSGLEALPAELQQRVLAEVPFLEAVRLQRVSRTLRRTVGEYLTAHGPTAVEPSMFPPGRGASDSAVCWLAARLQGVKSVNLRAQLMPCDDPKKAPFEPFARPYPVAHPPGEVAMRAIARSWPGLERLEVDDMSDEGLVVIARSMPGLLSLRLGKETLQDASLEALAAGAPRLRTLDLDTPGYHLEITDVGVGAVVRGCPNLRVLNLAMCDCHLVAAPTYEALAGGAARGLERVALPEPRFRHPGAALSAVLDACPRLASIDLFLNRTPNVLRELRLGGEGDAPRGFAQVRELTLTACMGLRDGDVGFIPLAFPRLETLRLSHLYGVHDGGIQQVARGCPGLRSVVLRQAYKVSDPALFTLLRGCSRLEHVALEDSSVSGRLLDALALDESLAPQLEAMDLAGTWDERAPEFLDERALGDPPVSVKHEHCEQLAAARPGLKLRWRMFTGVQHLHRGCFSSPHWPLSDYPKHW